MRKEKAIILLCVWIVIVCVWIAYAYLTQRPLGDIIIGIIISIASILTFIARTKKSDAIL